MADDNVSLSEEFEKNELSVEPTDNSPKSCFENSELESGKIESVERQKESEKSFENLELDFESDIKESHVENIEKDVNSEGEVDDLKDEEKSDNEKELEEGEERDDGEILSTGDEDELEEGELKEKTTNNKTSERAVCRYFNRGKCSFGTVCRFLHLNNNSRGNYNMFSTGMQPSCTPYQNIVPTNEVYINPPRSHPQNRQEFFVAPPVLPPIEQASTIELAWERGLHKAKELVKKAHQRRSSPDFEDKKLNARISHNQIYTENERDRDKENEKEKKRHKRECDEDDSFFVEKEEKMWRGYDNFEVRYPPRDPYRENRSRSFFRADNSPKKNTEFERRDKKEDRLKGRYDFDPKKRNAEEWFDPYRRSKSPKGRRTRSRSYSTVSSYSYSERSSISPYSRSSSGSSDESSRSPSPLLPKRKPNESILSPKCENRFSSKKKSDRRNARSRSYSRSRSSRSRSIRSSSSRSISMDSITSAESGSSGSLNNKIPILTNKDEDKPAKQLFQQLQFLKKKKDPRKNDLDKGEGEFLEESPFSDLQETPTASFPSLQHLLPSAEKKEPVKAKQQIKLTLLNKNQPQKFPSISKEPDPIRNKEMDDESPNFNAPHSGTKRPLSPPSPSAKPPSFPKRSAISRRDELLKQLKAVEDAIARKRAKFY